MIVSIVVFILFIFATYFAYQIVNIIYNNRTNKKLFSTIFSSLILTVYIGFFFFLHVGASLFPDIFIKAYQFEEDTFYLYDVGFLDPRIEITKKHPILPIQSTTIRTILSSSLSLREENGFIYAQGDNIEVKIYDLKNHKTIK